MLGHGGIFLLSVNVLQNIKIGFVSVPAEYFPTRALDCNVSPPLTNKTWSFAGIAWCRSIVSFKYCTLWRTHGVVWKYKSDKKFELVKRWRCYWRLRNVCQGVVDVMNVFNEEQQKRDAWHTTIKMWHRTRIRVY